MLKAFVKKLMLIILTDLIYLEDHLLEIRVGEII